MELGEEAYGLLRQVHMLPVILAITSGLNLVFQDSVTISIIRPMVQSTITELKF